MRLKSNILLERVGERDGVGDGDPRHSLFDP